MGYLYIFVTLILTAYGQVILKWRLNQIGEMPESITSKLIFVFRLLIDPYIFSSFFSAFLASLTWMATLRIFDLSKAYPFMSVSYVLVMFVSAWLLHESLNVYKIAGSFLIIAGVIVMSKG